MAKEGRVSQSNVTLKIEVDTSGFVKAINKLLPVARGGIRYTKQLTCWDPKCEGFPIFDMEAHINWHAQRSVIEQYERERLGGK